MCRSTEYADIKFLAVLSFVLENMDNTGLHDAERVLGCYVDSYGVDVWVYVRSDDYCGCFGGR